MGKTVSSWQIVVEEEVARMNEFKQALRAEDRIIFTDLLDKYKLYASAAEAIALPAKHFPLLFSMVFVNHKRIIELGKCMKEQLK